MKHGDPNPDIPIEVWLGPDPELALVNADMDAWVNAGHDCGFMYYGQCDCDADEDCVLIDSVRAALAEDDT